MQLRDGLHGNQRPSFRAISTEDAEKSKHFRENSLGVLFANRGLRPFSENKLREKDRQEVRLQRDSRNSEECRQRSGHPAISHARQENPEALTVNHFVFEIDVFNPQSEDFVDTHPRQSQEPLKLS